MGSRWSVKGRRETGKGRDGKGNAFEVLVEFNVVKLQFFRE